MVPSSDLLRLLVDDHLALAAQVARMMPGNGQLELLELHGSGFFVHQSEGDSDAIDDGLRARRATGNVEVHREDFLDWA